MKKTFKNRWFTVLLTAIMVAAVSCKGDEGPMGPAGPKGDAGPQGVQGEQGIPGKDGNLFYYGNGAPAATLGKAGDMYLDKSASKLYGPKTESGWDAGQSLKGAKGDKGATGATGAAGSKILSGTGAPAAALGAVGDYYINKTTGSLYGPKTASGWGTAISLKGPKGDPGNANVKVLGWYDFKRPTDWSNITGNAKGFTYDNTVLDLSPATITAVIDNQEYVLLGYMRKKNDALKRTYQMPFISSSAQFKDFGEVSKVFKCELLRFMNAPFLQITLEGLAPTPAVIAYKGDWQFRAVFIKFNGTLRSTHSKEAFEKELQKLSYEEVCERYGIEP